MDLTDLQVELRKLETQISALHGEIEKMKPKREEKIDVDFKAITKLANSKPVCREKLKKANKEVKRLLFSSLAFIIVQSNENMSSKLLYLCRLAIGSEFSSTAEELYTLGLRFTTDDLDVLIRSIGDKKYAYLTELFIIAHIDGEASEDTVYAVADIANMMAFDKDDLQAISLIAKSVLTHREDYLINIPTPSTNKWRGQFNDYISESWLASQRKIVKTIPESFYQKGVYCGWYTNKIEQYIPNGTFVQQGEVLVKCLVSKDFRLVNEYNIEAECSGIVDFVKYEEKVSTWIEEWTDIIIGSYFDTYEQILAWHKKQQRNK